jgi:hypothetical protein
MRTFILLFLLFLPGLCYAQKYSVIDKENEKETMEEARTEMEGFLKIMVDSFAKAYMQDSSQFKDKNGKDSHLKITFYMVKIMFPERIKMYDEWASSTLTKEEYKYFKTLKFQVNKSSDISFAAFQNTIDYDMDWLSTSSVSTTMLVKSDFSYFEHIYYLTSYDITGIIDPPFIDKIISIDDTKNYLINAIVNIAFDYFMLMHEFYHQYYEGRLKIMAHDEIAADDFALKKWGIFTANPDSDVVMNDSYLEDINQFIGSGVISSYLNKQATCKTCRTFNDGVYFKDYIKALLGIRIAELFFKTDSRFFFIRPEQISSDLIRIEHFVEVGNRYLKCKKNDSSSFCASMTSYKALVDNTREMLLKFKAINPDSMRSDTTSYYRINKDDAGFIAFNMGNYYAITKKDFKTALRYYSSVNYLKKISEFTVICNLLCRDILNIKPELGDDGLAELHLRIAREVNAAYPTVRNEMLE